MKFWLAFLLLLTAGAVTAADLEIEYGSKAELRGVTRIFIDVGDAIEFREQAVAILAKEAPSLRVADKLADAEVVLVVEFEGVRGIVSVVRPGSHKNAVRLLAKYTDEKTSRWTPKLSTILMRRFARDWREAHK